MKIWIAIRYREAYEEEKKKRKENNQANAYQYGGASSYDGGTEYTYGLGGGYNYGYGPSTTQESVSHSTPGKKNRLATPKGFGKTLNVY